MNNLSQIKKEKMLQDEISKYCPDRIIYDKEQSRYVAGYIKALGELKGLKNTSIKSLIYELGYTLKQFGYREADMRVFSDTYDRENINKLVESVFKKCVLLGEYIPTEEESKELFSRARDIVQDVINNEYKPNLYDREILVLATIQFLKNWWRSGNPEDEKSFWSDIYKQYIFVPEEDTVYKEFYDRLNTRLYKYFCDAIKYVMEKYNRFLASKGNIYYNSLLIHAISPKHSIFDLFDILFYIYDNNLNFQYVENDTIYTVFAKAMKSKIDGDYKNQEEVKIKSEFYISSIKTLFQERPGYIAVLSDELVKKIDILCNGNKLEIENYWDKLLIEWFNEKCSFEKIRIKNNTKDIVVTDKERIVLKYRFKDEKVGIDIPTNIRLPETGDKLPRLKIYQNRNCIYDNKLSIMGNELGRTIKKTFIPLENTDCDFSEKLELEAEIIDMNGKELYCSKDKLKCINLLFDKDGNFKDNFTKFGEGYLFTSNNVDVEFRGNYQAYKHIHEGQLYDIDTAFIDSIAIDGKEIFANNNVSSNFRHHTSKKPISNILVKDEKEYYIHNSNFLLTLKVPEIDTKLRYIVKIDDIVHNINEYWNEENEEICINIEKDSLCHCIRVVDITKNVVCYEYNYVIISDIHYTLHNLIYRDIDNKIDFDVYFKNQKFEFLDLIIQEEGIVNFNIPGLDYNFILKVPIINFKFLNNNGFLAPDIIWHDDIKQTEFVELIVPQGYKCLLMVDDDIVPQGIKQNMFGLGNFLQGIKTYKDEALLNILVQDFVGNEQKFEISKIVFKPRFQEEPLFENNGNLCWSGKSYIGDLSSQFSVEIYKNDEHINTYKTDINNHILDNTENFEKGSYKYKIYNKSDNIFLFDELEFICEGDLFIGNPMEFMFEGMTINLENASYWDLNTNSQKTVNIIFNGGILDCMKYKGDSIPSGEVVPLPHFEGRLSFINNNTGKRYFFNKYESEDFELINPVQVWIVNDYLMILRCATEDSVYVDVKNEIILNRSPEKFMNYNEQLKRLCNPDYFKYNIK